MKKIMSFGLAAAFIAVSIMSAQAMVRYEDKYPKKIREVRITGFIDYAPFGLHPASGQQNARQIFFGLSADD